MTNRSASSPISRREFVRRSALATMLASMSGCAITRTRDPNAKLNIAAIGIGGKGESDTNICRGENIVATCDVDEAKMEVRRLRGNFPNAKSYQDYRKMLEEMDKSIDAVIIATPDHTHAAIASLAMKMGKHVYCQKPLTQTIYEARYLRDLARRTRVVTQMGNQGSNTDGLRRAAEVVQAGLIGPVRQVYVWSNRPIWPQGVDRPTGEDPVPATLNWDLWLGPAPARPYKEWAPYLGRRPQGGVANGVYHAFNWRGWLDFGTGALGDMACHTANLPFRALKLGYATEVEAIVPEGMNRETYPLASKIRFEFPAREGLVPLTFWWYDGGKPQTTRNQNLNRGIHDSSNKPPKEVTADIEAFFSVVPDSGCLLIGDKGKLFSRDDYGTQFHFKLEGMSTFVEGRNRQTGEHEAIRSIPQSIPRSPTFTNDRAMDEGHHLEWIKAIKESRPELCYSRFDIAAYLTEIILLGCVAMRAGKKLQWDGPNMRAKNAPEVAHFVKREMRAGWRLA
jgi:hypothetical protein